MKITCIKTAKQSFEVGGCYHWSDTAYPPVTEIRELGQYPYTCFRLMLDNGCSVRILDAVLVEERPDD